MSRVIRPHSNRDFVFWSHALRKRLGRKAKMRIHQCLSLPTDKVCRRKKPHKTKIKKKKKKELLKRKLVFSWKAKKRGNT